MPEFFSRAKETPPYYPAIRNLEGSIDPLKLPDYLAVLAYAAVLDRETLL